MSPSVVCYPTPLKDKSRLLCEDFAAGCGGTVASRIALQPGAAFFYGVTDATLGVWRAARAEGRDWYYCDNAYFDVARERYFRITRNAFQLSGPAEPDNARFEALYPWSRMKPWRKTGRHIVVCETSAWFMELCGYGPHWLTDTLGELARHTDRPVRLRRWLGNKVAQAASLQADLDGAWALVTHCSAAANEAVLAGIPVFVTGESAAAPMASGPLSNIEHPLTPAGRREWAAGLASNQWTQAEIRNGTAWRSLNGRDHDPAA